MIPTSFAGWRSPVLVCAAATILGLGIVLLPSQTWGLAGLVALGLTVLQLPRVAIVLFLAFLCFQDPLRVAAGWDTPAATIVKRLDEPWILVLGTTALLLRGTRNALAERWLVPAIAASYGGMVLSTFGGAAPLRAVGIDLVLFSKSFLLLAIGASIECDGAGMRRQLPRIAAIAAVILALSLVVFVFPGLEGRYVGSFKEAEERLGMTVARGIFIDTGTFSWFAVAVAAGGYAAWLVLAERRYLLLAAASALMLLLTWRRKSILALAVIFAVSIFAQRQPAARWRSLSVVAIVALVVVVFLIPQLRSMADQTVHEYGGADPYGTARTALYYASVQIARDHFPLGTGLASFGSYASSIEYSSVYREYGLAGIWGLSPWGDAFVTDTFWPMVLGQGGVVSLAGYLAFLAILGSVALGASRAAGPRPVMHVLALASLFLVVGSFVESIASHIYGSSLHAALVFLPVGMLLRALSTAEVRSAPELSGVVAGAEP